MPFDPSNAIDGLQSALPFDPVKLAALRDKRKGELEDQLIAAQATGDLPLATLSKGRLGPLTSDIQGDPYTGAAPHQAVADILQAQSQAKQAGYNSPAEALAGERQFELSKQAAGPQASAAGQLQLETQKEAGAKQRFSELQQLIQSGKLGQLESVNLPGGGSVKTVPPSQMLPGGAAGPAAKQLETDLNTYGQLSTHPSTTDKVTDWLAGSSLGNLLGAKTIEQRKSEMLDKVKRNQDILSGKVQTGALPSAVSAPADLRQRAISALKSHNLDSTNETFIKEAMRQLGNQ